MQMTALFYAMHTAVIDILLMIGYNIEYHITSYLELFCVPGRDGLMSICIFGDSISKGVVFDETKQKYTVLKDNFVSLVSAKLNIAVKNYSSFGCTVDKGHRVMDRKVSDIDTSSYTILEFGGNDCDYDWPKISEDPAVIHPTRVPIEKFRSTYEQMIEETLAHGSTPILMTLPPLNSERFFNWVTKDLDKTRVLHFLHDDVNTIFRHQAAYNDMIFELAKEYGLTVFDIRNEFMKQKDYSQFLCVDGMHPNAQGHRLIAGCIENGILGLA